MSYGLIYTIPFASLEEVSYVVKIEKEGYDGESTELVAGANPFVVEISNEEFLYTPSRFSTATVEVVGSDYLSTLFSTEYRQFRVTLERNGVVEWCGYIKPELYTQDYSSDLFSLELECISAMSVLEFIDYTSENEIKQFVSLWYLLQKCISEARGKYEGVYIPHVYAIDKNGYDTGENVFEKMLISEQNFFDEDGKPMKLKEILDEICKLFGWTCADWNGSLYFVDIDHTGLYYKYDGSLQSRTVESINEVVVQEVGFAGSDHSLDILPGYNKVVVKCSNYSISDILNFDFDFDELSAFIDPLNPKRDDIVEGNEVSHRVFLNPGNHLLLEQYTLNLDGTFSLVDDISEYKDNVNALFGAIPMKFSNYEMEEENGKYIPSITDYNYTDALRVRIKSEPGKDAPALDLYNNVFRIKGPCAGYFAGAICINGSMMIGWSSEISPLDKTHLYGAKTVSFSLNIGDYGYSKQNGWVKGYKGVFDCQMKRDEGGDQYYKIENGKTLEMPYPGASGLIIPIPGILAGELEFCMSYRPKSLDFDEVGHIWKDFRLSYVKQGEEISSRDSDRIYENVLNEDYINELDEIELKISSYNDDGACYSKVLLDGNYLTDNLYNSILGKNKRLEELLITRIINHYSDTRIKLTQIVKNSKEISPLTILTDNFLVSKRFINAGGSIDYAADRFECIMIEK